MTTLASAKSRKISHDEIWSRVTNTTTKAQDPTHISVINQEEGKEEVKNLNCNNNYIN